MNAHIKTLMNVSGIAKRNGRLPLVRADNISANSLMSRLICPLNHALQPFDIRDTLPKITAQALVACISLCQQPAWIMLL